MDDLAARHAGHTDARSAGTPGELAELFLEFAGAEGHVLWVLDLLPQQRVRFVSRAFETVWGVREAELYADALRWTAAIHPHDRHAVEQAFARWLNEPDQAAFDVEYRIVRPDGALRWIHDVGHVPAGAGRPLRRVSGIAEDITQRKLAELALQSEQQRATAIADVAPMVLCSFRRAADGHISFPFGGLRADQLYGVPAGSSERDASAVFSRIHPQDLAAVQSSIEASARGMQPWRAEFRMLSDSGREQWIEGHSTPVAEADGGIVWHGAVADITERKRTERALADSRARLAAVVAHMTEGLVQCSSDGRLVEWNAAALAMHGLSESEACGLDLAQAARIFELRELDGTLLPSDRWPLPAVMRGQTLRQQEYRIHHRVLGWNKVFSYSGTRIDDENGRARFGLIQCSDVTARRATEDEVQRLNAELEQRVAERTAELQAAVKELEAFSYSVSHDLRAPLRALDGFSQALVEDHAGALPEQGQRYLSIIRDTAQKMGQLIDDLLEFSRLGRHSMTKRVVDHAMLVRHAFDALAAQRGDRPIELQVGELPACQADPALLRQVWINLLGNAVKYTRGRDPARIEVGHRRDGDAVEYFVRDNGAGFDMRYVHKLFGVFERLHRAEEFEGTGVGLAIVQRIVQRHGGQVRAWGEPGRGASFHFTLG